MGKTFTANERVESFNDVFFTCLKLTFFLFIPCPNTVSFSLDADDWVAEGAPLATLGDNSTRVVRACVIRTRDHVNRAGSWRFDAARLSCKMVEGLASDSSDVFASAILDHGIGAVDLFHTDVAMVELVHSACFV